MGGCAAAYGGVVVRSLSCEAMRSMKVLSIPAVVFLFGFGYVVNFTAVSLFIFGFGLFCSYLGEFKFNYFPVFLLWDSFIAFYPSFEDFLMQVFLGSRGNSSTYNEMIWKIGLSFRRATLPR